jgi:colicin import membrane protein
MNDNTIIRIKVPASLYESVKAKLMIKEETETPVKEGSTRGLDAETIEAVNRALKMIMQEINVEKDPQQRDLLKKTTVNLGQISQFLQTKWARKGAESMNEAKKVDPKKAAEEKKKIEDKKKAEEKKKKEAEAKKVADKKAADKKKADAKKK